MVMRVFWLSILSSSSFVFNFCWVIGLVTWLQSLMAYLGKSRRGYDPTAVKDSLPNPPGQDIPFAIVAITITS